MFERKSLRKIYLMSFPSMRIFPEEHSKIRSKQFMIVDFPAPVRPTMPIF